MQYIVQPGGALRGRLRVPGDKSISHRSVILGALSNGVTEVTGLLEGADVLATIAAFRAMGVAIEGPREGCLRIHGVGLQGLQAPQIPLDCGNSGTAMRLLAGVLAGQRFASTLIGDESLQRRPMGRVIEPLRQMGARITAQEGRAPLQIVGAPLHGINYTLPIASAQVKSAILLAGLYAKGRTCVREPAPTRDHSERMLRGFGYALAQEPLYSCLEGGGTLQAQTIDVPADISSATFFLLGATIAPDSDLLLENVGINPTRTGVIEILTRMGARIDLTQLREVGGEPVADIRVRSARLQGIDIPPRLVPLAIDEFPAVFIAAACAEGRTVISGAEELRVKESDRIAVMATGLRTLGIAVEEQPDGAIIHGGALQGGRVDSHGDHRIAMSFAMAALRAAGPIQIEDCRNVATSFPNFPELAIEAGLSLQVQEG
ncbi:3-phosphoshikimate 1-carboxyvinyltransferase [Candidatus Igneacidithiobacillus taiwanensis]|uniref:3-phosphoshikimate 1-carboxyvinyltransferase n=1 Tax=Candidatus Igneacidithiobacillus taiwanensis TaxID=1945924 RepID=UPI00289E4FF2|nr:3-phosphoshikimate 1-carboxyvinyltransferase [Candidatus Igneacidithiobacillus taiwanensis]